MHAAHTTNTQQHAATRSNTQQHAATRSNTQQHAAPRSTTQHHAATDRLYQWLTLLQVRRNATSLHVGTGPYSTADQG